MVIRGNHIHDCWGEGIGVWFAAHVEISDNIVERAFNVGIYMDDASSVTIENPVKPARAPKLANYGRSKIRWPARNSERS